MTDNDLLLFYKIVNTLIPVKLPAYITVCQPEGSRYHGTSRNRFSRNSKIFRRSTATAHAHIAGYLISKKRDCDIFVNPKFTKILQLICTKRDLIESPKRDLIENGQIM